VKKDLEGAARLFEDLLAQGVRQARGLHPARKLLQPEPQAVEGEKALQDGIRSQPRLQHAAPRIRQVLRRQHAPGPGRAEMRKVIELEPGQPMHKFSLAGLYWESGRKRRPWT